MSAVTSDLGPGAETAQGRCGTGAEHLLLMILMRLSRSNLNALCSYGVAPSWPSYDGGIS
jgi:hypothetical protein